MENIYKCNVQDWVRQTHTAEGFIPYSLEHSYFINKSADIFFIQRGVKDHKSTVILMLLLLTEAEHSEDILE